MMSESWFQKYASYLVFLLNLSVVGLVLHIIEILKVNVSNEVLNERFLKLYFQKITNSQIWSTQETNDP